MESRNVLLEYTGYDSADDLRALSDDELNELSASLEQERIELKGVQRIVNEMRDERSLAAEAAARNPDASLDQGIGRAVGNLELNQPANGDE